MVSVKELGSDQGDRKCKNGEIVVDGAGFMGLGAFGGDLEGGVP